MKDIVLPQEAWQDVEPGTEALVEEWLVKAGDTVKKEQSLVTLGFDPVYGARPLKRTIQRQVDNVLSTAILRGDVKPNDVVVFDVGADRPFEIRIQNR